MEAENNLCPQNQLLFFFDLVNLNTAEKKAQGKQQLWLKVLILSRGVFKMYHNSAITLRASKCS